MSVVRKIVPPAPAHVQEIAGGKIKHGGKIREVAGPVNPGAHKAAEIAKGAFAPNVKSAFLRITRREFDDGKRERCIEGEPGAEPDDHRARPGAGSRGNPAQADAGDHVKQHQVQGPHGPLRPEQFRTGGRHRSLLIFCCCVNPARRFESGHWPLLCLKISRKRSFTASSWLLLEAAKADNYRPEKLRLLCKSPQYPRTVAGNAVWGYTSHFLS